jgi:hypothetical protein
MTEPIIWLHEDALRITHPVVKAAPATARVIHIWDDAYLKNAGYGLKRLVFIYETLRTLPIEIIRGDTRDVLQKSGAGAFYIPASNTPFIKKIVDELSSNNNVTIIADEPFVHIAKPRDFNRFFQYWGKAEKSAFLHNGGADA